LRELLSVVVSVDNLHAKLPASEPEPRSEAGLRQAPVSG
jgi:hypothetical protein